MPVGDVAKALLSSLRYRVGDPGALHFTDAECYAALNWGYIEIANVLPDAPLYRLFRVAVIALWAPTSAYPMPTDLLRERIVQYKGLTARRWPLLETGTTGYAAPTEADPAYLIWGGNVQLLNAVTGTGNLSVGYIKQPATISGTVDPELGREFDDLVEMYAYQTLLQRDDDTQPHAGMLMDRIRMLVDIIVQRYQSGGPYTGAPQDPRRMQDVSKSSGTR